MAVQSYADPQAYDDNDKDILQLVSHQIANIIERKRNETALLKSQRETSLILENMEELIVYRNMDFETIWASKSASNYHKLSPEDMRGRVCYKARYGIDSPFLTDQVP